MINRAAARIALGIIASGLVLSSCSSGGERSASTQAAAPTGVAVPVVPASPSAAGISGLPLTPGATTAAALDPVVTRTILRRVVLFSTDLPPDLTPPQTLVVEDPTAVAARVSDPAPFLERSRRWGRIASISTVFATAKPLEDGGRTIRSGAILFSSEQGARAQLDSVRSAGPVGALTDVGLADGSPVNAAGEASTPAGIGDEALAWRTLPDGTLPPSAVVAFRRGAVVVVVIAGEDEAARLARILDQRATDAQR